MSFILSFLILPRSINLLQHLARHIDEFVDKLESFVSVECELRMNRTHLLIAATRTACPAHHVCFVGR